MNRIRLTKANYPDAHWLRYCNEDWIVKHVGLSSCANSFSLTAACDSPNDGKQCIGWHYEENGCFCYELFTVGHLVLFASLKPGLLDYFFSLFRGKSAQELRRERIDCFEQALNQGGWKTIPRINHV